MRVTSKGQVTIPVEIRERMGIFANSEVDFVVQGESGHPAEGLRQHSARQTYRRANAWPSHDTHVDR